MMPRPKERYLLHAFLFLATVFTTTMAGVAWRGADPLRLENYGLGLEYAFLLLFFLSAHEFGHYIAARIHKVSATLPYYIPFPGALIGVAPSFGTLGAVIRTRSRIPSNKALFDIGVSGPIAGFIVCIGVLVVGFLTLPGIGYLQGIHPGYPEVEGAGAQLVFGKSLLYSLMERLAPSSAYVPPMSEMYHYPMLAVGWFGLFVTSLNLLPVGQLDGGHLFYSLFGRNIHRVVGRITTISLFLMSVPALLLDLSREGFVTLPDWWRSITLSGGSSWLLWALITAFIIRAKHPATIVEERLDRRRAVIGYLTILIFILCFTPSPIVIE